MRIRIFWLFCFVIAAAAPVWADKTNPAQADPAKQDLGHLGLGKSEDFDKLPTTIIANSLIVHSNDRTFEYQGAVKVEHGDVTLLSDLLEGTYTEQNKIKELVASKNVVITKADSIRGQSQKATYFAETGTVVLTENPEVTQHGNILSADQIKVFLNEDRSEAHGNVKVRLIGQATPTPGPVAPNTLAVTP